MSESVNPELDIWTAIFPECNGCIMNFGFWTGYDAEGTVEKFPPLPGETVGFIIGNSSYCDYCRRVLMKMPKTEP